MNNSSVNVEGKRIKNTKSKQLAKTHVNDYDVFLTVWLGGIFILNVAYKYIYSDSVCNHFIESVIHWFYVGWLSINNEFKNPGSVTNYKSKLFAPLKLNID